jgi:ribosomal-protein-alanine N-acetyltransferase
MKYPTIETKRLLIRSFDGDDVDSFLEFYNQPDTMKFVGSGCSAWTREEILEKVDACSQTKPFGIYTVCLKAENKVIGEVSLFNSFESGDRAEIGYIIHQAYWGKGYGFEAVEAFVSVCKKEWGSRKVVARMYEDNTASAAICRKMKMKLIAKDKLTGKAVRLTYEI